MNTDKPMWYLENIDVTGIFCPQKSANILESHVHKTFKKGAYVYLPDEYADRIYFIAEGQIKIGTYSDDGKEITKSILTKGEVFGELSLIGENRRRDFAVALESTLVCIVTVEEMKGLMREYSPLNMFMMTILGNRLLKMEQRLEALVFKDSRTRIIDFLKDLAKEKGKKVGFETLVRGFLTHQEIANLTATSRQTVTTVLNELRRDNIIYFNRRKLLIRDLDKLC